MTGIQQRGLSVLLLIATCAANSADLLVKIEGVKGEYGGLLVGHYQSPDAFPTIGREVAGAKLLPHDGTLFATLSGIVPGSYAVAVVHDEDGDGALDKGWFGIPKEGHGFSNYPESATGTPEFSDASFSLPDEGATVTIGMRY